MAKIDEVIIQSLNPFDNIAARNFWAEENPSPTVESIHQEALTQIESVLTDVAQDRQSRTLILYGDGGSGKTHFMGRLKQKLNDRAFFVYIDPFPHSDHIWRHILRYTVDSLVNAPAGQTDSQLIQWLKSCLSNIRKGLKSEQQSLIDRIKGVFGQTKTDTLQDRQDFINILRKTIGTSGIYNANEFFGVLYSLTDPDLYPLACEWLKGDPLDEESLKKLRVRQDIDNEDKAQGILGNFSKISAKTRPIVLCFDQLDNIARLPDGSIDLQALFNVSSTIYNGAWKSFLIIISIRTSTWNNNHKRLQSSDLDRASLKIPLKRITLQEVEALWATRLYPLHQQAEEKCDAIHPLGLSELEKAFPSHKASPRQALTLGKQLFQDYKESLFKDKPTLPIKPNPLTPTPPPPIEAEFKLLWQQEYKKVQGKISKITLVAIPDLIRMLQEVLTALQVQGIKPKLLTGRFANNSLSYQQPSQKERIGIVWTEDPGMRPFFDIMSACQKALNNNQCQRLQLVRAGDVGTPKLAGNQIYRQIFIHTQHCHIRPNLSSVHYLVTYHNLVNSAQADELVVAAKSINLKELEALIRQCQIFQDCLLLNDLNIVSGSATKVTDLQSAKDYLLNLVITQQFMGRKTLIQNARKQFVQISESQIEELLNHLYQENKLRIINPKAKPEAQSVCLVV